VWLGTSEIGRYGDEVLDAGRVTSLDFSRQNTGNESMGSNGMYVELFVQKPGFVAIPRGVEPR
jgi:hypothetical protein